MRQIPYRIGETLSLRCVQRMSRTCRGVLPIFACLKGSRVGLGKPHVLGFWKEPDSWSSVTGEVLGDAACVRRSLGGRGETNGGRELLA